MIPSPKQLATPDNLRPTHHSPEFERALHLYAAAVATQRLALEVHARCHRRRATDRPVPVAPRVEARAVAAPVAAPPVAAPVAADVTPEQLTPRQREVVRLISRGCTNAEIADLLVVTRGTAANHVAAILTRLGVTNRTQVAAWAIAVGLLERESPRPNSG